MFRAPFTRQPLRLTSRHGQTHTGTCLKGGPSRERYCSSPPPCLTPESILSHTHTHAPTHFHHRHFYTHHTRGLSGKSIRTNGGWPKPPPPLTQTTTPPPALSSRHISFSSKTAVHKGISISKDNNSKQEQQPPQPQQQACSLDVRLESAPVP
jgi:hypothetical protein